ncbi:Uncharacterised protein [Mycobacterium tuberculosis]|uniref:Uncharacterized protein n=1 Tax=Mycobacterium tuberculosis TaxID=1773 RepID=A0A916LGT3_MYCTX|nr:Uncharacterised protein [Mycobacterium tuberculosis]CPB34201.1 Uncharacterised protein [Mycobacterium tuberculosis]
MPLVGLQPRIVGVDERFVTVRADVRNGPFRVRIRGGAPVDLHQQDRAIAPQKLRGARDDRALEALNVDLQQTHREGQLGGERVQRGTRHPCPLANPNSSRVV